MLTVRTFFIPVFLLLCSALLQGQSAQDRTNLQRDLETYRRATMNLEYDSLLSFMPPKLLALAPPEQLKAQIEGAFDNEMLYMVLDSMVYGEVPPVSKTGDYLYALVSYTGHMQMHFKQERDSAFLNMMVPALEAQFSKGSVTIMEADDKNFLSIDLQQKNLIAFKASDFDTWKFIEDKRSPGTEETDSQMMLLNMVVPAEILDATK
ncbi:MAG: hypothetical protein EP344_00335 [Bacteroidetes bacterium]|nr:MAG: hypothetical protein EP344_00335 [Bacteroidota bacterium]